MSEGGLMSSRKVDFNDRDIDIAVAAFLEAGFASGLAASVRAALGERATPEAFVAAGASFVKNSNPGGLIQCVAGAIRAAAEEVGP